ncbi:hypothetical protein CHISP_3264 [Chitinispirillum alkaliphilum]|nr:hypothetical protein CHISP_3264 [Chitinispirillum alkaliphilum]
MNRTIFLIHLLLICTANINGQHQEFSGSGDDVIIIEKPQENVPALLYVEGNKSQRHFSITAYDSDRNLVGLLVNTLKTYSGIVGLDLPSQTETRMLEISAVGPWLIHLYPIEKATVIEIGETLTAKGDNVLRISGDAITATIIGNASQSHFSVTAYDESGSLKGLMVNTINEYSGKVLVPDNAAILEIRAVGNWEVTLE